MVSFEQVNAAVSQSPSHQPSQDELRKEVERLRYEVELAAKGIVISEEDAEVDTPMPPEAILRGFYSPDDFVIKEKSVDYHHGGSYKGEMLGTLRHGTGTYIQSNGNRYTGQWRYNVLEGRGTAVTKSGQTYEGEFRQGHASGLGVAVYENGSRYEGDWENDQRHGWGTQTFTGGESYEGEWANDQINGRGRYTYSDGSYFEGLLADGERVEGKLVSLDGSSEYNGAWKDNQRSGHGVQYIAQLSKYDGGWFKDKQHGKGRCEWFDGSVYNGDWKEGKRNGKGKFAAGRAGYDGEWVDDKFHGQGIYLEENGDRYIGAFEGGERHGFGRCLYGDGTKYEGEWKEGKRWGQGTCVYARGDVYTGAWERDQRHGVGFCRFADGSKFNGGWEDDGWVQSGADPALCEVEGTGVTRGVAGKKAMFKILAKDEDGNQRLSGGDEFQVLLVQHPEVDLSMGTTQQSEKGKETGNSSDNGDEALMVAPPEDAMLAVPVVNVTGQVIDCEDGTYEVTYVATKAGIYELSITVGATEHVADSPYPLRILPADPYPRKTLVQGPGRSLAVASTTARFDIQLHDEFGNPCSSTLEVPLETYLENSTGHEIPISMTPNALDGRLMCSYEAPATCGFYRLHVEWGGAALPGTPFSVSVISEEEAERNKNAGEINASDDDLLNNNSEAQEGNPASGDTLEQPGSRKKASKSKSSGIRDEMALWERIAAAAYATDGATEGWDSEEEDRKKRETKDEAYMREHPDVPVVENLEDLWMVSKLQREKKAREEQEKQKKLQEVKERLEGEFGPGQVPTPEEAEAALREILQEEAEKKVAESSKHPAANGASSNKQHSKEIQINPAAGDKGLPKVVAASKRHTRAELEATAAALDDLA